MKKDFKPLGESLVTIRGNGEVVIKIGMPPRAQHRPRYTKAGIAYKDQAQKENECEFKELLDRALRKQPTFQIFQEGRCLALEAVFEFKIPNTRRREYQAKDGIMWHVSRPDTDNLLKFVLDCCNGMLWVDDCQCVIINAMKIYGDQDSITLTVKEVS